MEKEEKEQEMGRKWSWRRWGRRMSCSQIRKGDSLVCRSSCRGFKGYQEGKMMVTYVEESLGAGLGWMQGA